MTYYVVYTIEDGWSFKIRVESIEVRVLVDATRRVVGGKALRDEITRVLKEKHPKPSILAVFDHAPILGD